VLPDRYAKETEMRRAQRGQQITETVQNNHGYTVRSMTDVLWDPALHSRIPFRDNPFVGGSPAFDSWQNDGVTAERVPMKIHVGTPDEKKIFPMRDIYARPKLEGRSGDFVIIPTLWARGEERVFQIVGQSGGSAQHIAGTPSLGGFDLALIDLRDVMSRRIITGVGAAFIRKVSGPAGSRGGDASPEEIAFDRARDYMASWTPPQSPGAPEAELPEPEVREPERRVVRRRPGEADPLAAMAAQQRRNAPMTPAEKAALLRREGAEVEELVAEAVAEILRLG
jgi:hypothetical protein